MLDEDPICGRGLAEHAILPKKLAELVRALAETLEVHRSTLVLEDAAAKVEHAAYGALAREYRAIASQLATAAHHMASYYDLPPAPHHPERMASLEVRDAQGRYLAVERELVALLRAAIEHDAPRQR
jgi:hypothetical protein